MANKKAKKKVLALPITVADDDKVLLLEPGDEIIVVPDEELHPGRDEAPEESPADEEAVEDEEETGGIADRLKGSLPVGGDEDAEDAEEPEEADDDEPEAPEPDDETGPGFADRLKAKLPIGGRDEPEQAEDEPDEADEEPDEPTEPADQIEPEPEADEPEVPVRTIDLEDVELDVETLEASGEGLTDVEVGDEPRPVTLDPIPYVPTPSEGTDDRTADEDEVEEPVEETEPVLDRGLVDKIRYNVDMAIYRTAKERRERTVEDPGAAVDEVIAGAETEPPEPVEEPTGSLPETDTRIETVPGIDDGSAGRLREAGVETITDLVERDDVALAVDTDLRVQEIRGWKQVAELLHVPGLEPRHAEILTEVGINRVDLLAEQDPDDLRKRVVQYLKYREHEPGADLTTDTTRDWIDSAGEVRQGA